MIFTLNVNGASVSVDAPAVTPLLWVIREELKLTGTKFGCGVGLCGACVVAYRRQTRVFMPDAGVECCRQGSDDDRGAFARLLASLQKAWLAERLPQCFELTTPHRVHGP